MGRQRMDEIGDHSGGLHPFPFAGQPLILTGLVSDIRFLLFGQLADDAFSQGHRIHRVGFMAFGGGRGMNFQHCVMRIENPDAGQRAIEKMFQRFGALIQNLVQRGTARQRRSDLGAEFPQRHTFRQSFFRFLAFGNVFADAQNADRFAGFIKPRGQGQLNPQFPAVRGDFLHLAGDALFFFKDVLMDLFDSAPAVSVFGIQFVNFFFADHFLGGIAQHVLGAFVPEENIAVKIRPHNGNRRRAFQYILECGLFLA